MPRTIPAKTTMGHAIVSVVLVIGNTVQQVDAGAACSHIATPWQLQHLTVAQVQACTAKDMAAIAGPVCAGFTASIIQWLQPVAMTGFSGPCLAFTPPQAMQVSSKDTP